MRHTALSTTTIIFYLMHCFCTHKKVSVKTKNIFGKSHSNYLKKRKGKINYVEIQDGKEFMTSIWFIE